MNDRDTIISNMLKAATVENERLRANIDLLCAAIADDSLGRVALQTVARAIRHPMKPTPEVIAWAQKVIREPGALEQKVDNNA